MIKLRYKYFMCGRNKDCNRCGESWINWDLNPIYATRSLESICVRCLAHLEETDPRFGLGLYQYSKDFNISDFLNG